LRVNTRTLTRAQGLHGIESDVFLSLPCVLGENGLTHIVKQALTDGERQQLYMSAKTLQDVQNSLSL
jgi:L-lactate dehydrogenase